MVTVHTFSEVGGHAHNEDAFVVQVHPQAADCWLATLADGQGGQVGGGPAARLACQTALNTAIALRPTALTVPTTWVSVLRGADVAVQADTLAGYTTLIGLCVSTSRVAGASSGDSAVLLATPNGCVELTKQQQKNPPVGSGGAVFTPFQAPLTLPWRLALLSDGVWKYVGWERVRQIVQHEPLANVVTQLQSAARLPGSGRFPDDFTVVLLADAGSA